MLDRQLFPHLKKYSILFESDHTFYDFMASSDHEANRIAEYYANQINKGAYTVLKVLEKEK